MFPPTSYTYGCGHEVQLPSPAHLPAVRAPFTIVEGNGRIVCLEAVQPESQKHADAFIDIT